MRLTLFILICSIGTMAAAPLYSQQPRLDIAYENESLSRVLNDLRSRTDYHLVYSPEAVSGRKPVTLRKSNASIEEILDEILPQNGLTYTIESNVISIIRAKTGTSQQPHQTHTVSGNVTTDHGEPLTGVTVIVPGTTIGVATDINGNYTLRIPDAGPGTKLRFTMIGKAPFETEINGRVRINAIMQESSKSIDEAVAMGMVNIFGRDVAGSYAQIKMDSIYMPSYNNISDMLQGVVPGMIVTMPSLRAGAASNIVIRGRTTLLGSTAPLWVVDGIVQTDVQATQGEWDGSSNGMNELIGDAISWLNPQDVEMITVLKDATATAIYGSRASNGVIVITTKRGSASRQSLNFNYNVSVSQQYNYGLYQLMNSQERINFSKYAYEAGVSYLNVPLPQMHTYEGMYNMFLSGDLNEADFIERYKYLETVNTDWLDLLTRPAINQNLNLSTSGGTDKITYSVSASYSKNDALEKGNSSERFTGRINVDMRFTDKITVSANLTAGLTNTEGFAGGVNPLGYATQTSRAIPVYNEDGSLAFYQRRASYPYNSEISATGLPYNILDDMSNTSTRLENPTLQATIDFRWKMLPNLTFQVTGGMNINSRSSESWMGENSYELTHYYRGYRIGSPESFDATYRNAAILRNGGILITDNTFVRSYNVRAQFNYFKQFENDTRLTASAIWNVESSYRNSKYNTVYGYDKLRGERINAPTPPDEIKPKGISYGPTDYIDTYGNFVKGAWKSTNFTDNNTGLVMIAAYSIKEKYIINANFRNDWSNAFGQNTNRRFNPAWSVGASWRFGDEEFLRGSRLLSSAEFRLTYGTQGNTASTNSPEMILSYKTVHPIFQEPTSRIDRVANPFKSWERTVNWNAGFDLGLFDNKISMTIEGYTRRSDAGRTFNEIPEMGGFTSNLPGTIIRNSGIEGSISFTPIYTEDWRVSLSINSSKNWNRIVKEEVREATSSNMGSYIQDTSDEFIVEGYPIGAFWAYPYAGPHPDYGIPTFYNFPNDGSIDSNVAGWHPTEYLTYMGSKYSDITCGLGLRINYKRLSINTMLSLIVGGNGYLYNPYSQFVGGRMPDPTMNLDSELLEGWTKDNRDTNIPGLYIVPNEMEYPLRLSDPSIIDGSRLIDRYSMWATSDARVASLTALRCRSINATWRINTANAKGLAGNMLQKTGIRDISLTAAVNNVFLLADRRWNGMDPDMGGNKKAPRSFTFGINFGF